MDIRLNLPQTALCDFRIVFQNPAARNTGDGITMVTGDLRPYTCEIARRLTDAGFFLEKLEDHPWTKDCFYAYLHPDDAKLEFPQMKVYIQPTEIAGWAPEHEAQILLDIANSFLTDVRLVYREQVYNIDHDRYRKILRESEDRILAWLAEYRKHHNGPMGAAGQRFHALFGVKRLQNRHLSYRDYTTANYIERLVRKL